MGVVSEEMLEPGELRLFHESARQTRRLPRLTLPTISGSRAAIACTAILVIALGPSPWERSIAALVALLIVYFGGRADGAADLSRDILGRSVRASRRPEPSRADEEDD